MSKIFRKRSTKTGMPPGSLVHIGEILSDHVTVSLIDYDEKSFAEYNNVSIEKCVKSLNDPSITWVHVSGISEPSIIEQLGKKFNLHPLMMEDILNSGQISKLDDYKETIFIVMRMLKINGMHLAEGEKEIVDEQISFVLGSHFLISFMESDTDVFGSVRTRLRAENSRIRKYGADYLCYALIDSIVDGYFLILEAVDDKLEHLEESLINNPSPKTLMNIQKRKRDVLLLRKSVWPMREVLSNLLRTESPLIKENTKTFFHDVYDHTIQVIDTIESFRDIASGMLDIYLSNMSQRLNEIMKVLTIVSTIFVPLTFIASVYGMNFEYIPELHSNYGYYIVLTVMVTVAISMLIFFHKKKWI